MFCSYTHHNYDLDKEVALKRRHLVIDHLRDEESKAVEEDYVGELGVLRDDDVVKPPPQLD